MKQVFLSCSDVLFDDLPSKNSIIISRTKDMPVSARNIERHISEMATVSEQQTLH